MHPAYSVILFTTASGAGYGLLILLAAAALLGLVPPSSGLGIVGLGLALGLIGAGLLSSTAHLGRPERAWRAFSQWRSSWLSREGVAAVATFVPAGLLAIGWVLVGSVAGGFALAAAATILLALVTVWCTGMIYASLPTIRAWHQPAVAPIYILLALATGAVLLNLVLALAGMPARWAVWVAVVALSISWLLKTAYWSRIDTAPRELTAGAATGLGRLGRVRSLEPAHSQPNFVMREMGYQIARKHAAKLRRIVVLALFLVPLACLLLSLVVDAHVALLLALVAALSAAAGVATERWLFFAEAEHAVMLFYGAERV